ncbi:NAD(P)h-dependent fmn reductase [Seminavis robusta]|uniref:NAD(P)h-dependent fmn reductase n=1 Tax=Seminavis robusta TaxID=568900 RepID=A0A9N8DKV5_9STRA|nr:NAD(P)h-dependent fmn reductase [Seminavis robusta]|eukprot:Sro200_g084670.1 NAD(P)h-dependent fmn reductase (269) ;mRNA; f:32443-33249
MVMIPSFLSRSCRRHRPQRGNPKQLIALSLSVVLSCGGRPFSSSSVQALNTVVITGTTRTEGPPRPILGPRVAQYIRQRLEHRGHTVTAVLDPLELNLPLLEKPHFAYAPSQVPPQLEEIATLLEQADAYVTITPEFNHAPSPGLVNILNHFGSSKFSFKPSAIVTYSAGQWGGTRAAQGLRPILSELGCLPVSAMIHIPNVHQVLDTDGTVLESSSQNQNEKWDSYSDRCFSQLEWWAQAASNQRQLVDPFQVSPAFLQNPSQRNAP